MPLRCLRTCRGFGTKCLDRKAAKWRLRKRQPDAAATAARGQIIYPAKIAACRGAVQALLHLFKSPQTQVGRFSGSSNLTHARQFKLSLLLYAIRVTLANGGTKVAMLLWPVTGRPPRNGRKPGHFDSLPTPKGMGKGSGSHHILSGPGLRGCNLGGWQKDFMFTLPQTRSATSPPPPDGQHFPAWARPEASPARARSTPKSCADAGSAG